MGSKKIQVVDFPVSFLIKLWFIALAGLFVPQLVAHYWPDRSWPGQVQEAYLTSFNQKTWQDPWQPIGPAGAFESGWVRCSSLADALELDRRLDDGYLHSGRLILTEGGLAWLAR